MSKLLRLVLEYQSGKTEAMQISQLNWERAEQQQRTWLKKII